MKKFLLFIFITFAAFATFAAVINLSRINGKISFNDGEYHLGNVYLMDGNLSPDVLELLGKTSNIKIVPVTVGYFGPLIVFENKIKARREKIDTKRAGLAKARAAANSGKKTMVRSAVGAVAGGKSAEYFEAPISLDNMENCLGDDIEASISGSIEKDAKGLLIKVYSFECYDINGKSVL